METLLTEHTIRYAQETVNTKFSQGKITVAETLFALIYRWIDPECLPAVRIILYHGKMWCVDTRRLMIIHELIRRKQWDIVNAIPMTFITKDDRAEADQFNDFVRNRYPSMKRKKMDGLSIKVSDKYGSMCCYNREKNCFRHDLDQHIARDHLKMPLKFLKTLSEYKCKICHQSTRIQCEKHRIKRQMCYAMDSLCRCTDNPLMSLDLPLHETTLKDIYAALIVYPVFILEYTLSISDDTETEEDN